MLPSTTPEIRAAEPSAIAGPWRDGRSMVVRVGQAIPPVCLLTGLPTANAETHDVEVAPRVVRVLSVLLLWVGLLEWATKHVELSVPLTGEIEILRRRGRRRARATTLAGFGLLLLFLLLDTNAMPWLDLSIIPAMILLMHGVCGLVRPVPLPHGVRLRGGFVWLNGVHRAARTPLPRWSRAVLRSEHERPVTSPRRSMTPAETENVATP